MTYFSVVFCGGGPIKPKCFEITPHLYMVNHILTFHFSKDNFTFKCHRSDVSQSGQTQDVYAVNDIAFHPQHGTLATVGSDGKYSFWDKDARTKLKTSESCNQPISSCCFNAEGSIFAYAVGYDWTKVSSTFF